MLGDVINTFTNTTTAVNQKFIRKSQIEKVPDTRSPSRKIDITIMSFQVMLFCCPMFRKLSQYTTQK